MVSQLEKQHLIINLEFKYLVGIRLKVKGQMFASFYNIRVNIGQQMKSLGVGLSLCIVGNVMQRSVSSNR